MVDVFCACIETGVLPSFGSPCHRKARQLVEDSGCKPKRMRKRLTKQRKVKEPKWGVVFGPVAEAKDKEAWKP